MDLEQGKKYMKGLLDNYGLSVNEFKNLSTEQQVKLANDYKNARTEFNLPNNLEEEVRLRKRASELEFDEPEAKQPVTSDNATASNASSLEGFLKKTRLHDPQSAADLLNRQNKPIKEGIQLGGDGEEAVEGNTDERGGFNPMSALNKRLIDYNKNKSGSAILEKKAEEEDFNLMSDRQRAETFDAKKEKDHLAEQFDSSGTNRAKWLQNIIDNPEKAMGGQLPKWWSKGWEKKADDAGGIRPEPGESLLEFNERLQGKDFTDKDLKGKISDENIADQLILDEQRKTLKNPTAKDLDIGPESGLDQERVPEIKKLFNEKDPEAELIASEYEAKSGLMNKAIIKEKVINDKAQKQINKKIKEPKKKVPEKAPYAPELEQQISSIVNPMGTPEGVNDEASIMADVESSLKLLNNAKTEEEKEKIIKKVEDKVTTPEEKKHLRAMTKEQGPDRYYIDPLTGYALNVSKVARRKGAMQIANMLPAADRATFLYSKGIIDKPDFDALMGPGTRAALDLKLKTMQIEEANYKIMAAKKKAEKDPKRAEYISMFTNAMSTKNFGMVSYLGGKLGLDKEIMDRAEESFKEHELNKLRSKANKGGLGKAFKSDFGVDYSNVVNNKAKWINYATSLIQTSGQFAEISDIYGVTKTVDRSAKFRSYGLYEQEDMKNKTHAEQIEIFNRSPYRNALMTNTKYHNKKGEFDPSILVNNKDAYERYLMDDLVSQALNDIYEGNYEQMMKWISKNSYNYEREQAKLEKLLTSTSFSGGDPAINN